MKILGIIPARYASTRFPAKLMAEVAGKTIIERVYTQASQAMMLDEVVVATDHKIIYDHAQAFGAQVYMTSENHVSGTDRCYEVLQRMNKPFDYVVNIQGDEPFIAPDQIDLLVSLLDGKVELATLIKKIENYTEVGNTHAIKVIINKHNEAIYFSRGLLPYLENVPHKDVLTHFPYFKHIGLYAYRSDILASVSKLAPSPLEVAESLEQLRWIEHGYTIKVGETTKESLTVDTREDLANVLAHIKDKS